MDENLSICEFEAAATTRMLTSLPIDRTTRTIPEKLTIGDALVKSSYAVNNVIRDINLYEKLRSIVRGSHVYLIYIDTGRIMCQICVDGYYSNGLIRKPKILLIGRHGYIHGNLPELIDSIVKLGDSKYSRKRKEIYHANN